MRPLRDPRVLVNPRRRHLRSVVALAAAFALGCAGSRPALAPPAPAKTARASDELTFPGPVRVGSRELARLRVRFVGVTRATAAELAKDLAVRRGVLEDEALERDELVLCAWYYDRGHVDVRVERSMEVRADEAIVTFRVHEGLPYRVRAIAAFEELSGARVPPLGWTPPLHAGEIFSRVALVRAIDAMRTTYHDLGYAYVDAVPQTDVDPARHEIALFVPVVRGPLTFVERVVVDGNHRVGTDEIRGRLLVKVGDRYGDTPLLRSKDGLLDTGWFTRVDVSTKRGSAPDRIVVTFEVDEEPSAWPLVAMARSPRDPLEGLP